MSRWVAASSALVIAVTLLTISSALARPVRPSSARAIVFAEEVRFSIWDELADSVRRISAAKETRSLAASPSNLAISALASSTTAIVAGARVGLRSAMGAGTEAR